MKFVNCGSLFELGFLINSNQAIKARRRHFDSKI